MEVSTNVHQDIGSTKANIMQFVPAKLWFLSQPPHSCQSSNSFAVIRRFSRQPSLLYANEHCWIAASRWAPMRLLTKVARAAPAFGNSDRVNSAASRFPRPCGGVVRYVRLCDSIQRDATAEELAMKLCGTHPMFNWAQITYVVHNLALTVYCLLCLQAGFQ